MKGCVFMSIRSVAEPITRGFCSGWNKVGFVKRNPDTRTRKELLQTIDAYAQKNETVKSLSKEIKSLDDKSMGTIADLLELNRNRSLLTTTVSQVEKAYTQNINNNLIKDVILASKENPAGIKFIDSIINNTDSLTSKATLASLPQKYILNKSIAPQMEATAEVMPEIAKEALDGKFFNPYELTAQKDFINYLNTFVNPENKPDKIKSIFSEVCKVCDRFKENIPIDLIGYLRSSAPMAQIRENLKAAEKVIKELGEKAKNFNIVDFLIKKY